MTWYSRMEVSWAMLRVPTAEPMAWKAALLGTNTVTSFKPSSVVASMVSVNAPTMDVMLVARAVSEMFIGGMRTVSISWTTPPVKLMFCSSSTDTLLRRGG